MTISLDEFEKNAVGKWESLKECRLERDCTRFDSRRTSHSYCREADGKRWHTNWDMDSTDAVRCPGKKKWELEFTPWLWLENIWKRWRSFTASGHKWLCSTISTLSNLALYNLMSNLLIINGLTVSFRWNWRLQFQISVWEELKWQRILTPFTWGQKMVHQTQTWQCKPSSK